MWQLKKHPVHKITSIHYFVIIVFVSDVRIFIYGSVVKFCMARDAESHFLGHARHKLPPMNSPLGESSASRRPALSFNYVIR